VVGNSMVLKKGKFLKGVEMAHGVNSGGGEREAAFEHERATNSVIGKKKKVI